MKELLQEWRKFTENVHRGDIIKEFVLESGLAEEWHKEMVNEDVNMYKATPADLKAMITTGKNMDPKFYNKEKALQFVKDIGGGDANAGFKVLWDRVKKMQAHTPPSGAPKRGDMPVIPPEKGALKIAKGLLNKGRIDVRPPYAGGEEGAQDTATAQHKGAAAAEKTGFAGAGESEITKKRKAKQKELGLAERASDMSPSEIDPKQFPNWGGPRRGPDAQRFLNKGTKDQTTDDDKVQVSPSQTPASKLFPSQSQIWLGKALGMAVGGVKGGDIGAIISKDGHILDGHHRWAATMLSDPSAQLGGVTADLNIGDLIPVLRSVGDAMGFPRRP